MTFYDCKETICEALNKHIQNTLRTKGLVVMDVVTHHTEILSSVNDPYSSALLRTGLAHESAPTFSNKPRTDFKWLIRDHIEVFFEALGWPTTQAQAHRIVSSLRRKSIGEILTHEQTQALEEVEMAAKEIARIREWLIRARNIVVTISANFPLLREVTEEEREFSRLLSSFDWYYSYSDQASTYRNGEERHGKVGQQVVVTLATKPHLQKVVDVVAKANGLGSGFFTFTGKSW